MISANQRWSALTKWNRWSALISADGHQRWDRWWPLISAFARLGKVAKNRQRRRGTINGADQRWSVLISADDQRLSSAISFCQRWSALIGADQRWWSYHVASHFCPQMCFPTLLSLLVAFLLMTKHPMDCPLDVHWMSIGRPMDVHWKSNGQTMDVQ